MTAQTTDSSSQDPASSAEAAFLLELQEALDALEPRELCHGRLLTTDNKCCALGAVILLRGLAKPGDHVSWYQVSGKTLPLALGITSALANRVAGANDMNIDEDFNARWRRMRLWVHAGLQVLRQSAAKSRAER